MKPVTTIIRWDDGFCFDADGTLCDAAKADTNEAATGGYRCTKYKVDLEMHDVDWPIQCEKCKGGHKVTTEQDAFAKCKAEMKAKAELFARQAQPLFVRNGWTWETWKVPTVEQIQRLLESLVEHLTFPTEGTGFTATFSRRLEALVLRFEKDGRVTYHGALRVIADDVVVFVGVEKFVLSSEVEETRFLRGHPHQKGITLNELVYRSGLPRDELMARINAGEIGTHDPGGRVQEIGRYSGYRVELRKANKLLRELGKPQIESQKISRMIPGRGALPLAKQRGKRRKTVEG